MRPILPTLFKIHKLWWDRWIIHHSWSMDHGILNAPAIRTYHSSWRIDGHIVSYDEYKRRKAINDGDLFQSKWFDDDPSYHYLIEYYKQHPEILIGLPMTEKGAHCAGMNSRSLGTCFIGKFDDVAPPDELLKYAATHLFAPVLTISGYKPDILEPHSKYANKSCPGKKFDMDRLRQMVEDSMHGKR